MEKSKLPVVVLAALVLIACCTSAGCVDEFLKQPVDPAAADLSNYIEGAWKKVDSDAYMWFRADHTYYWYSWWPNGEVWGYSGNWTKLKILWYQSEDGLRDFVISKDTNTLIETPTSKSSAKYYEDKYVRIDLKDLPIPKDRS